MSTEHGTAEPRAVMERLRDTINAHDLDAMVECFATDFRSELPFSPEASFVGSDTVRRNWEGLFAAVPDLTAAIVSSTTNAPDTIWVEWEQHGTQADGRSHLARGVIIATVADGRIASNRFYVQMIQSESAAGGRP